MKQFGTMFLLMVLAVVSSGWGRASAVRPRADGRPEAEKLVALLLASSFRDAERFARRLLEADDLHPHTLALCGLALLKAGRLGEAEGILSKAVRRSPAEPDAHLGLGRIAFARNDAGAAIDHLRRAVPSARFHEEALRLLWRATQERGDVDELLAIAKLAGERFRRESEPLPSFFRNGLAQVAGLAGRRFFRMDGRCDRIRLRLAALEDHPGVRMAAFRLNGRGEYLFHLDSALAGFMTISPLLAEELGLSPSGSASSTGVGTAAIATRFAVLEAVAIGPLTFRDVPVMVSDVRALRGQRQGLVGTAFLKRFNVTIDAGAGTMDLFPLERPDLLAAAIDRQAVVADVPLHVFDQTVVEASVAGSPPALFILDSAAATNLIDIAHFEEHLAAKIDPARIVQGGIEGAGGTQHVRRVDGLPVALGPLVFAGQQMNLFPMAGLNGISGRYAAGLLGNPLLWPYRVHMDFRAGRLILERYLAPTARNAGK
jgi:hypothetical protein